MMNQKERLETLEKFLWRLNFHRTVTMREDKVHEMLRMADAWVASHGDHNGERPEKDVKRNVQAAYERLTQLP